MTAPESTAAPAAKKGRPPALTAMIIVAIVAVLAVGAFVVYKLTDTKESAAPAFQVAKDAVAAVADGNQATIRSLSEGEGTTQLLAFSSNDVSGLTVTYAGCKRLPGDQPTRECTASRPGGQLSMRLVLVDGTWKVDQATIGPAATTPTSSTTTTP